MMDVPLDSEPSQLLFTDGVAGRDITVDEWAQLIEMSQSEGWKVYMDLKRCALEINARDGLDPLMPDDARYPCCVTHSNIERDLSFFDDMKMIIAGTELPGGSQKA